MFSIASYLAEKISSLIAWRSASSVFPAMPINVGTIERGEGVELDEQHRPLGDIEAEMLNLKKLLEEAKVREEENVRKMEELEVLRKEVEVLRKELVEERKGEKKEKEDNDEELRSYSPPPPPPQQDLSESEVVDLVKSLNQEILHLSEIIVKAFENVDRPTTRSEDEDVPEELKEAYACVEEILGERMVGLLVKKSDEDGGEVVRMALKASMAAYTHWIISSWYFENPEDENLLSEIYARVREAEEQTVSGRWRALTRIHLQRMLATEPDLTIYMVDAFVNIILTAGWHNNATALQQYLIQTFGDRISRLLTKAKRMNKMIGEEIIKCDLEALFIAPEVAFNSVTMEAVGGAGDEEKVLCTTDLGLVKAEKRLGRAGEWDEAVLLKPKVVFDA